MPLVASPVPSLHRQAWRAGFIALGLYLVGAVAFLARQSRGDPDAYASGWGAIPHDQVALASFALVLKLAVLFALLRPDRGLVSTGRLAVATAFAGSLSFVGGTQLGYHAPWHVAATFFVGLQVTALMVLLLGAPLLRHFLEQVRVLPRTQATGADTVSSGAP